MLILPINTLASEFTPAFLRGQKLILLVEIRLLHAVCSFTVAELSLANAVGMYIMYSSLALL